MSINQTFSIAVFALMVTTVSAQNYRVNYGANYGANQSANYNQRTSNDCDTNQGQGGFRPLRNLVQNIRKLGLGRSWIPMSRVPENSKQKQIGKGVARWQWGQSVCTATMITPRHAMLNYHCLHGRHAKFGNKYLTFNYEDGKSRNQMERYTCNRVIMQDANLDMAILECSGSPGSKYGYAELERGQPPRGTETFSVHHPSGGTKKYSEGTYIPYSNHTAGMTQIIIPGSSGSSTYDAKTGKMIMLNNKYNWSTDRWGRGRGDKSGRGIKTSYIVKAIESRLGSDFLPKSGANSVNSSAFIAQNNQGSNRVQYGEQNQRPTIPQPVVPKMNNPQVIRPSQQMANNGQSFSQPQVQQRQTGRRLISSYNQAPLQKSPALQNPVIQSSGLNNAPAYNNQGAYKSNVHRSIADGVLSQTKANYLNERAYAAPKKQIIPQVPAGNNLQLNQQLNQPMAQIPTPPIAVAPGQYQRRVIRLNGGVNQGNNVPAYNNNQSANNQPAYNNNQGANNNQQYQPDQQTGPVRQMFQNMAQRIRGRKFRRNQGPMWVPIENLPQDTAPKQVAKSVGKFINYGKTKTFWENGQRVTAHPQGNCTATLISPKHIILNSHCNSHKDIIENRAEVVFNYEQGKNKGEQKAFACNKIVLRDKPKDIMIVECEGRPGDEFGYVELEEKDVPAKTPTYIVHHPGGTPKKYSEGQYGGPAMTPNTYWDGRMNVWQNTPTDKSSTFNTGLIKGGSSGSLTFDANTNKAIMLNNSAKSDEIPSQAQGHTSASVVRLIKQRGLGHILAKSSSDQSQNSNASYAQR